MDRDGCSSDRGAVSSCSRSRMPATSGRRTTATGCGRSSPSPRRFSTSREVVVVDEPWVGLDPKNIRIVKEFLKERARDGLTVFMSTHTLSIAEEVADRIGIIHRGRLLHVGTRGGDQGLATARAPWRRSSWSSPGRTRDTTLGPPCCQAPDHLEHRSVHPAAVPAQNRRGEPVGGAPLGRRLPGLWHGPSAAGALGSELLGVGDTGRSDWSSSPAGLFTFALFAMLVFSNVLVTFATLYRAREVHFLIGSPISRRASSSAASPSACRSAPGPPPSSARRFFSPTASRGGSPGFYLAAVLIPPLRDHPGRGRGAGDAPPRSPSGALASRTSSRAGDLCRGSAGGPRRPQPATPPSSTRVGRWSSFSRRSLGPRARGFPAPGWRTGSWLQGQDGAKTPSSRCCSSWPMPRFLTWIAGEAAVLFFYPGWSALSGSPWERSKPAGRGILGRLDRLLPLSPSPNAE